MDSNDGDKMINVPEFLKGVTDTQNSQGLLIDEAIHRLYVNINCACFSDKLLFQIAADFASSRYHYRPERSESGDKHSSPLPDFVMVHGIVHDVVHDIV